MAKRRHAAALFEVFHDIRGPSPRGGSASRGFFSWLRGRGEGGGAVDPNDPTTMPMKSPLIATRSTEAPDQAPPQSRRENVAPADRQASSVATAPGASTTGANESTAGLDAGGHFQVHLDRNRRELTVRVQFATAVVTCAAIVLAVALSYVLGRKAGTHPAVLAAETPTDMHTGDVKPSALDIPRRPSLPAAAATPLPPRRSIMFDSNPGEHESTPQANSVHGLRPVPPPAVSDGKRIIGLNYYIIQTYPNETSAIEARDFLLKNGVGCTAERVPHGFGAEPTWFAVITSRGFDREQLHTPDCDNLRKQIDRIGEKFASTGKFKRFLSPPPLYKLKETKTE